MISEESQLRMKEFRPVRLDASMSEEGGFSGHNTSTPQGAISFDYENTVGKRVLAFILDLIVIGIAFSIFVVFASVIGVLSFGLLMGPLFALSSLIPLAYHTWYLGGPKSATLGMRYMNIELRTWDGRRPGYLQAALQTIAFYVSCTVTTWLILVAVFFNDRKRTVHDMLCGTQVINTPV